jgi:hypothetical protein
MAYQTIQLLVNVNEDTRANAVVDYAIEFARREAAHLSALIVAQVVGFPSPAFCRWRKQSSR